ncbi:GNAT family N-acetyltransferase [Marmoricola sp. URHB0036]|jgi:GNAT superfamily N-acetyltransferase|uniref:GNAT family N-acetyltransferase n=1 Tax=Marmoricola sp. URHB0036 TaxID=1298863 RepID=UPI00040AB403|nr:GNAT family N-acetyltransferase [Marmoricola sp. URHB0036]
MSACDASLETEAPVLATADDASVVTRILVDAFRDDPMWGPWAFPDPATRRASREAVFRIVVEGALAHPHVWLSADRCAAALWIPPGGRELSPEQEERIDAVLRAALGDGAAAVLRAFERFEEVRPSEPHQYLTLLGTRPDHWGKGVGGRLLRANLRELDAEGTPAYLEASDELVSYYERFGFRGSSRFVVDDGPTVNAMWRDPEPV